MPRADKEKIFSIGIGGSVGFIGFVTGSVGITWDTSGSIGFYASGGGGASTGLTTGVGLDLGYNNAPGGISSQRGTEAFGGVSGGVGPGIGVDMEDDGLAVQPGWGYDWSLAMPFEGHVGVQNTYLHQLR